MNVVYIKHFENGKKYIGITNNFERRMGQHKRRANDSNYKHLPLYRAMNKYEHYTEVVFESELYSDVQEMEIIIIQNFKDLGYDLYNVTSGGESTKGIKLSKVTRERMSESQKGHIVTEGMRRKIKEKQSGVNCVLYGKKGKDCKNSKPKEYFETTPVTRGNFKTTCKRQGWDFEDFEEVFSGEKTKGNHKKYYYIYKGE